MSSSVGPSQEAIEDEQRLTELLMAISLATDLGLGQPMGQTLRSCYLSVCVASEMGCTPPDIRTVLEVSLLRTLGCTGDSAETAAMSGGDDRAFHAAMGPVAMGSQRDVMTTLVRSLGPGQSRMKRARMAAKALSDPGGAARALSIHCEVAAMLARRLGLGDAVVTALSHGFERWDGKGYPAGLREEAVPIAVRIAIVASDADMFIRLGDDPVEWLRARAGRAYDPSVVDAFIRCGPAALVAYDACDGWDAVLACEPQPHMTIQNSRLDQVLSVIADFGDLKSPWTRGHSRTVSELAEATGAEIGLDIDDLGMLRQAGLVHDIGRVGVENGIWDKPGPLTIEEWERVRLHPYFTQRILARCRALAPLGEVASSHHERLDGSGYHRQLDGAQLSMTARILAAADVFVALCSDRPHRPAMSHSEAADLLEQEVRSGCLDGNAVAAVLALAGVKQGRALRQWPAGLTEREIEVLRSIAKGKSNRQVADQLFISPKTVGRHIENIYNKIGVSTRAGAAVFAMEQRLLG